MLGPTPGQTDSTGFISYPVAVPQKSICVAWHIIREKSETNDGRRGGCTSSNVILSRVYAAVVGVVGGTRGGVSVAFAP